MPNCNRSKRLLQRSISHNSEGLTETEHVRSSSAMDRPSSNSFGHKSILSKTSTLNKRGCAILTKKVAPKNPGTYLKLRPKNPEPYLKLRPKNPGTRNATLSFYMRKLTTQIRKSLITTPRFSFTYFVKGFYYFTFVL